MLTGNMKVSFRMHFGAVLIVRVVLNFNRFAVLIWSFDFFFHLYTTYLNLVFKKYQQIHQLKVKFKPTFESRNIWWVFKCFDFYAMKNVQGAECVQSFEHFFKKRKPKAQNIHLYFSYRSLWKYCVKFCIVEVIVEWPFQEVVLNKR